MKLSTLVAALDYCDSKTLVNNIPSVDIYSYQPLLTTTKLYPGIIYIGDLTSLPDDVPDSSSFFLVGNNACELPNKLEKCNVVTFCSDMMTLLNNVGEIMTAEHRLQSDKQSLVQALNVAKGLQHLVDEAYRLLKNPIIVVDSAYKILAMNSEIIEDRPDLELQRDLGI